ncbi:MAG: tyrosine-type recombinase/integrase [Janthinobacterium lividum]
MATARITDTAIRSLPTEGEAYLWDPELKGFGVRASGTTRTFVVKYRVQGGDGRQRKFKLGGFPALNATAARARAKDVLQAVARGEDPAGERSEDREGFTVAQGLDLFMSEHVEAKRKDTTAAHYGDIVRLHLKPRLGAMKVRALATPDAERLHSAMRATPIIANRCLAVLSKFATWCELRGLRDKMTNPVRGVEKYGETKRERYLSVAEIERLVAVLDKVEADESEPASAITAIRLLLLTGARHREITELRWDTINLDRGIARIEGKTGVRNIYLNAAACAVVAAAPKRTGNPYVCWGRLKGSHLVALQRPWERIRAAAELPNVRVHDLRHTAASLAILDGASLPLVGKLLGHKSPLTTARYAHLADDPVQALAERVGARMGAKAPGATE